MDRKDSIINLKKLYLLLDELMGETLLGMKYTDPLKKELVHLKKINYL